MQEALVFCGKVLDEDKCEAKIGGQLGKKTLQGV
jgi:serine protease inhibitor ecotin